MRLFVSINYRKNMIKNLNYTLLIILTAVFISPGCKESENSNGRNSENIKVVRFEQELFNIDIYSPEKGIENLKSNNREFIPLFSNKIIEIGDTSDPWFEDALISFVTDQAIYNIYKRVIKTFPDFSKETKELSAAFNQFKIVFPDIATPVIYTYISGFNQSMVTTDSILGISLEKYLGKNDSLYNEVYPPIPQYQRCRMNPENIAVDALKAWITTEFEYAPKQDNLLSRMLYEGRNMFLLHKIFPEINDTLIWNFTPAQITFCTDNEKQMWTYLIEQKLLFIGDNFRINQFTEEAPFTKDFSTESPGKAAIWIGYKIIESYNKQANITIQQLMLESDFQKILNESRYRP